MAIERPVALLVGQLFFPEKAGSSPLHAGGDINPIARESKRQTKPITLNSVTVARVDTGREASKSSVAGFERLNMKPSSKVEECKRQT
ncbi:hypothetical protein [Bradyrhizobium sp. 2S1]|uniref:hypothetical protein n=1 Tax=Bradyrhizobium sp. 2S1 TaxID=1404429 RepID=UPI00140989FD|nr:hypothetical protein [Bradyrhizobium sp. 2S1]MCK7665842.1 hypothetical protein [Bradyrhizobium sp. 2S1]